MDNTKQNLCSSTFDSKLLDYYKAGISSANTLSNQIPEKTSDAQKFENITSNMLDTFIKKNHDYGNSFEQSLNEEGLTAARIRLGDKWNRFKSLSKSNEIFVKDESIRDTLMDAATYCIMTIMWLDKQCISITQTI